MVEKRLSLALEKLVARGDLSQEAATKVEIEYAQTTQLEDSRRKVLAEIGGYLGGLFIVISLILILNQQWRHISHIELFSLFLTMAFLLFAATFIIGKTTGVRSRLSGLLGATASASTTLAIISLRFSGDGVLTFAIFLGWGLTLLTYCWNRTIIGELSLAGYSIATGISGILLLSPRFKNDSYVAAFVFALVGTTWLILANSKFFNRPIGDAVAMSMLLFGGQIIFFGNFRFITYLLYLATVAAALWFYSHSPEWPLLIGAIAAITLGTGEFVGETLGGSLGATLGLLTSGIFFVSGSVYSLKRSKRLNNPLNNKYKPLKTL